MHKHSLFSATIYEYTIIVDKMASNNYDETDSCDTRLPKHKTHENISNNCSSEPTQRKNKPGRNEQSKCVG